MNDIRLPAAGGSQRLRRDTPRLVEGVERFQVCPGDRFAREHARRDNVLPLEHDLALAIEIAVEHEHGGLPGGFVDRGDEVDKRHVPVAREVGLQSGAADGIGFRLDPQIEHAAPCVPERPGIRIVDALTQDACLAGHERRDDVDELREAPNPDAIGIAQQRVDEAADKQRVLEVVDLFEQPGCGSAAAVARLRAARAVPDVPFVERQPQPLRRALQALHVVAHRGDLVNVAIHVEVHRQVARAAVARRPRRVAVIRVKRDAVDLVVALFEHFAVPDKVGRHEGAARSACNQLQLRIDDPHLLRRVTSLAAVLACLQLPDLPGTVHFVAETPVAHVVRPFVSVRAAQIAPACAACDVAVLDVGHGHLDGARAKVHPKQRLGADHGAPVDELVGPELIRLE